MIEPQLDIRQLSDHLFWDIDKSKLDIKKSKKTIIHRVLNYGKIEDWHILIKTYGIKEIADVAKSLKDLDLKSASFVALLDETPLNKFACYISRQSIPQHWNF
jgi:hypothetical protein